MFTNQDQGFFQPGQSVGGPSNFGGAGFMNDAGSNVQNRQGDFGGQRRKNRVFAPVTLKMIQEASPRPDDVCEIDGDQINEIIIVGRVTAKQEEPMRTLFEINDNTGTFKVIFYQKGENEVPIALKNFDYQRLMYVKVYGTIRVFKEEKAIVGTHIKKVEKFDEVTNHLLQVFVAHCIRKKGVLSNSALMGQQAQAGAAVGGSQRLGAAANNNAASNSRFDSNTGDSKSLILEVMKEISKTNKFIHKSDIYNVIQQKMGQNDFDQALVSLSDDGQIYSTYDNDIFSITE